MLVTATWPFCEVDNSSPATLITSRLRNLAAAAEPSSWRSKRRRPDIHEGFPNTGSATGDEEKWRLSLVFSP